jgi:DNA (cytosine-5)-methyltransferase 1
MRLEKRLKDVLEQNVDERYYLSDLSINRLVKNLGGGKLEADVNQSAKTILANCSKIQTFDNYIKVNLLAEPMIYDDYNSKFPQDQEVIGTITTQIGNPAPRHGFKIVELAEPLRIPQATKKGFVEVMPGSLFDMSYPESKTRRGRVQEGGKVSPTLMASGEGSCLYEGKVEQSHRIRKLTPKECFRLMGVSEGDIEKIQNSGVSQSQQYKMAGNSIVVDVLEHIFRKMFVETGQESQQLLLF